MRKSILSFEIAFACSSINLCIMISFNTVKSNMCISKAHFPIFKHCYKNVERIMWTLDLD